MRHKVENLLPQPHICLFAGLQLVAKQATGSLLPSTSNKPHCWELGVSVTIVPGHKIGIKSDIGISDHWDLAVNREPAFICNILHCNIYSQTMHSIHKLRMEMHFPVPHGPEVEEPPKPKRQTSSSNQIQLGALSHKRGIAEGFTEVFLLWTLCGRHPDHHRAPDFWLSAFGLKFSCVTSMWFDL